MMQWNWIIWGPFDDVFDKLENPSDDEIGAPWWPGGEMGGG